MVFVPISLKNFLKVSNSPEIHNVKYKTGLRGTKVKIVFQKKCKGIFMIKKKWDKDAE